MLAGDTVTFNLLLLVSALAVLSHRPKRGEIIELVRREKPTERREQLQK
jgi:hypothetical protein